MLEGADRYRKHSLTHKRCRLIRTHSSSRSARPMLITFVIPYRTLLNLDPHRNNPQPPPCDLPNESGVIACERGRLSPLNTRRRNCCSAYVACWPIATCCVATRFWSRTGNSGHRTIARAQRSVASDPQETYLLSRARCVLFTLDPPHQFARQPRGMTKSLDNAMIMTAARKKRAR